MKGLSSKILAIVHILTSKCEIPTNSHNKFRLLVHHPVQNPITDNNNILWNSPSLGMNSFSLTFHKPTLVYYLKVKREAHSSIFFQFS